jgi:alpha-methylacyl-CoA racemase
MTGALQGLRIVELAGIGPGPFAGMMLADHGATVIRVKRSGPELMSEAKDVLLRSRQTVTLDLKVDEGRRVLSDLVVSSHGVIEGFRPGVVERLGVGPDAMLALNPALVYGRITGWGQTGPYAQEAGHDINYIALSGALHAFGRAGEKPTPPINMVGDFGGGGMLLAFGMVTALLSAARTGRGQVVDCAMIDGANLLMNMIWSFRAMGLWNDERGTNLLDTGAPFYDTYETADGHYIAVGAIEPQFHAALLAGMGLDPTMDVASQHDREAWPERKRQYAEIFLSKTRAEWCAVLEGKEACFAPVLSMTEAPSHPHNTARDAFITIDGVTQGAPAPRFSGTPAPTPRMPDGASDTDAVLSAIGYSPERIAALRASGIVE